MRLLLHPVFHVSAAMNCIGLGAVLDITGLRTRFGVRCDLCINIALKSVAFNLIEDPDIEEWFCDWGTGLIVKRPGLYA